MANIDSNLYVTRREFQGAVGLIWAYIMFALGDLLRIEWRWTTFVLWAASFIMMCAYIVTIYRGGQARRTDKTTSLPPPEQVK
jgi:hypothetical protein